MIEELKIYFIEECNTSTLEFKYKSYPDLSGMTNNQLWNHANDYGYKEQRQIFHDCYYNSLFYDYYLADYRKIVLYHNSHFDWKIYKPTSEYDALIQYINQCDLSYNDLLDDVSYTNPHYSLVAECPNYDYQTFPFAYGAGQWSSGFFGVIVPCKSILKRVYFMYLYDGYENYETSEFLDVYDFNSSSVRIKMDLYINGIMSDYYVEETLDASKNMLGALFKKKNINGPTISVDYDEIIIEENSVISWFCSDLLSQTTNREYTNYPYNPARNRFIMILEPYNTRYVSNPNIDLETIKSDIEMNQYNISLKQNKLNAGNNIKIVDNIISVVGVSGVESNFYYVNQPCFRAYPSESVVISSGLSFTSLPFDVIDIDNADSYNISTYEYTIPVAGNWFFYWSCGVAAGENFVTTIRKNNIIYDRSVLDSTQAVRDYDTLTGKGLSMISCALGDVMNITVNGELQGASLAAGTGGNQFNSFGGFLIG